MTDDRLHAAVGHAQAGPEAEVGWEPPDWAAVLRRRRLRQWGGAAFLLLIAVVVVPLVRILLEQPSGVSWGWLALALGMAGMAGWSQFTAGGRAWWEKEARKEVRIGHALRHHVSIGAAGRQLVTERADKIDTVSGAALMGWPLVTVLFVVPLVAMADHPAARIGIGLAGLLAGVVLVRRNRRRVRWARRWLADPLPHGQGAP